MKFHHKMKAPGDDSDSIMVPDEKQEEVNEKENILQLKKDENKRIKKNARRKSFYLDYNKPEDFMRKPIIHLCNMLQCSKHKIIVNKYSRNSDKHSQTEESKKESDSDLRNQQVKRKMVGKETDSTSKLNGYEKNILKVVIPLCNMLFCSEHKTLVSKYLKSKKSGKHIQAKYYNSNTHQDEEGSENCLVMNLNDTRQEYDITDNEDSDMDYETDFDQKEDDSDSNFDQKEDDSDSDFDQKDDDSDSDFDQKDDDSDSDFDERRYHHIKRKVKYVRVLKKKHQQTSKKSTKRKESDSSDESLTDYQKFIAKKHEEKMAFLKFLKANDEEFDKAFAEAPKKETKKREIKPKLPVIIKKSDRLKNKDLIPLNEQALTRRAWEKEDDESDYTFESDSKHTASVRSKRKASIETDDSGSTSSKESYTTDETKISIKQHPLKRSNRLKDLDIDFSERALFEKAVCSKKDYMEIFRPIYI